MSQVYQTCTKKIYDIYEEYCDRYHFYETDDQNLQYHNLMCDEISYEFTIEELVFIFKKRVSILKKTLKNKLKVEAADRNREQEGTIRRLR